jgi:hypothetical protein
VQNNEGTFVRLQNDNELKEIENFSPSAVSKE